MTTEKYFECPNCGEEIISCDQCGVDFVENEEILCVDDGDAHVHNGCYDEWLTDQHVDETVTLSKPVEDEDEDDDEDEDEDEDDNKHKKQKKKL